MVTRIKYPKTEIKYAESIAGTLSKPGKMPCHSTSTPASSCKTGSKLAEVPNSVCFGCYALKGNYRRGNVQDALQRRLNGITHPEWVDAMVTLINSKGEDYFRWHDSGDIQDTAHLAKICEVARRTPHVKHWIPTREYAIVKAYRKAHDIPENLVIRLSAHMIDSKPPTGYGLPTSTVTTNESHRTCNAPEQNGKCADCRMCWNPSIPNIAYGLH
jgi:hypothetical protein